MHEGMNKEDLVFLKGLAKELKTQDTQGQAHPVYWGIMETHVEPAVRDEEEIRYHLDENYFTEEELVQYVKNKYYPNFTDEVKREWDEILEENCFRSMDIQEFCEDHCKGFETQKIKYVQNLSRDTGCFLTKKAAEEYIRKYGYNHFLPRTYAMTAYRNFELERLLDIIMNTNWDKINL